MFISASLRNYTRGASAFFVLLASLALSACGGGGGGGGDTGGGGGGTGGTGGGGTTSYTVGGTVSGLAGSLVLQNNGGDNLTITADGNFTFTTAVADGASYAVTVSSQPTGQTCTVSNASGAVSGANISNVSVSCANSGSGFTIGGTVNGLTGSLVLQNAGNNESLTVSADGGFTFTQSLADGEGYVVTVVTQPTGASCVVTNGSGSIASANVSNITISCSSRNLGFVSYGITTEAPSIVSSAFRVVDKASGTPVTGLGVDDFQVLEDGGVITQLESFKDLEPIDNIPYVFYTVLALDISSSLSLADIQQVKDTAKAIIADPVTGASKLQTNQQVAIYTFDGTVTQVAAFTSNVDTLLTAIDGISRGGPSTNLYGAIVTGMGRWVDSFSLSNVTYGAMVVVTDGDDTSGVYTEQDAINAVGNKLLYAIPVGSNVNQTTLENIAGVDHVFPATDFSELGTVFDQVTTELGRFSDGLYFLYYASPKRAGTHTIDVSIVGNTNTGTDASISGTFSAAGFSDVTPEVIISGDDYVTFGTPVTWSVTTRWSNDPINYSWSVSDSSILSVAETAGDSSSAILTNAGSIEGQVTVTVTDLNWSVSTSKTVNVVNAKPIARALPEYHRITVDWAPVQDAVSYQVYWNTTGGVTTADTLLASTTNTFVHHTDLDPSLTYYYLVVPTVNTYSVSASNEISAQPLSFVMAVQGGFRCSLEEITGVVCWDRQSEVPALSNPVGLSSATQGNHACALDDSGVVCWGNNNNGQTTVPALSNPVSVATGGSHTCALDDNGVSCWGLNNYGQASVPVLDNPISITAGLVHTCALDDSGVVCWGNNSNGQATVPSLSNPSRIVAGPSHTCALDDSGVVCWGNNSSGQTSVPALNNPSAIAAGLSHTCAQDNSGVVCWGSDAYGQASVPVLNNPTAIGAGGGTYFTCAKDDSGVVCWGDQVLNAPLSNPVAVSAGGYHTCAIDDSGVRCWGDNTVGQINVPTYPTWSNPVMVEVGGGNSCAIDDNGVRCWGANSQGQSTVPTLSNPILVSASGSHTCAIDDTGVVCWGANNYGQTTVPVLSNPVSVAAGGNHTCALDDSGVVCWGVNSSGQTTVPVLSNPVSVAAGAQHSCALDDNGVVCWGDNTFGQATVPALSNPVTVSAGGNNTCALDDSGVVCWGANDYGQSTVPALSNPVTVSVGSRHTCALDDSGMVCWGDNSSDQVIPLFQNNPVWR